MPNELQVRLANYLYLIVYLMQIRLIEEKEPKVVWEAKLEFSVA